VLGVAHFHKFQSTQNGLWDMHICPSAKQNPSHSSEEEQDLPPS
jgi:hypothetical protein